MSRYKFANRKNVLELIRYGFWGGVTSLLNLVLFFLFVHMGIPYLISNISTYWIAVIVSYFFNKKFVFKRDEEKKNCKELIKYFLVRILSVLADSSLLWISVDIFMFNIMISKSAISIFIIMLTYFLNKLFVFQK